MGTGVVGDISHRQDAGVGDVTIPFNQSFGGAGSPFPPGLSVRDLIVPAIVALVVLVVVRKLWKG